MRARLHWYRFANLAICSEMELPELPILESHRTIPDVSVVVAGEGPSRTLPFLGPISGATGHLSLAIPGVANYTINGGHRVTVAPTAGTDPAEVRLFLLGSVFGILLHSLALLPLHASAVRVGGAAVAFSGLSGEGKSTLAVHLSSSGWPLVVDDVSVLEVGTGGPGLLYQSIPRSKLLPDSAKAVGWLRDGRKAEMVGDKLHFQQEVLVRPLPLAALYLLARGPLGIHRLRAGESMRAMLSAVYRNDVLPAMGLTGAVAQRCLHLLSATPVFTLQREREEGELPKVLELLEHHWSELGVLA